jgi:hypothetical protein
VFEVAGNSLLQGRTWSSNQGTARASELGVSDAAQEKIAEGHRWCKWKKWREVNASDLPSRIMESFHSERIEYLPTDSRTLKATNLRVQGIVASPHLVQSPSQPLSWIHLVSFSFSSSDCNWLKRLRRHSAWCLGRSLAWQQIHPWTMGV